MDDRTLATMIWERKDSSGLVFLDVSTALCSASLCLNGAQLLSWIPKGQEEVLFVSSTSGYAPGKPIRGGIPVCWPWFGSKEGRSASHGYARNSLWTLESSYEKNGVMVILLSLGVKLPEHPSAQITFFLGQKLQMILETRAGSEPCVLTEAFHTYFHVGDVTACSLKGLGRESFMEFSRGQQIQGVGEDRFTPHCAIDRVYALDDQEGTVFIDDSVMKRSIEITRESSASLVVWNPWAEGSAMMPDLGGEEWKRFLCVEVANDSPSEVILQAGGVHRLRQVISVCSIN